MQRGELDGVGLAGIRAAGQQPENFLGVAARGSVVNRRTSELIVLAQYVDHVGIVPDAVGRCRGLPPRVGRIGEGGTTDRNSPESPRRVGLRRTDVRIPSPGVVVVAETRGRPNRRSSTDGRAPRKLSVGRSS